MASTRNNNTVNDYKLQQRRYENSRNYLDYKHSSFGAAYDPSIPALGYLPNRMSRDALSNNAVEIESKLFGINSINLVTPQKEIYPQLNTVPLKSFFHRNSVIMPDPLVIENNQRPYPIPQ